MPMLLDHEITTSRNSCLLSGVIDSGQLGNINPGYHHTVHLSLDNFTAMCQKTLNGVGANEFRKKDGQKKMVSFKLRLYILKSQSLFIISSHCPGCVISPWCLEQTTVNQD